MPAKQLYRGGRWEARPIDELGAIGDLEVEWRALAEARGNAFVTPEWLRAWFGHYGDRVRPAIVGVVDEAGELRGVLPMVESGRPRARVARFGGSNLGDVFHPAAAAGDEARVAAAALAALADAPNGHAAIVLERVEAAATWVDDLPLSALGRMAKPTSFRDEVLPLIALGDHDWESYLASRSPKLRKAIRRSERVLEREYALGYRMTADPAQLRRDLETFWRLHDARWDRRGGSAASTGLSHAFHADFAAAALERGWLRLWFLELDGEPVATWYGWRVGDRYSFYQAGFDPRFARYSVGFVLICRTIRAAIDEGAAIYDLLRGGEAYKLRLATGRREITTAVLRRRLHPVGLRLAAEAALWRMGQRLPRSLRDPARSAYRTMGRVFGSTPGL